MRSKCKIELLDFDQPPPGFELLSKTAHGREIFRYRYQLIPGEECERREQAVALAWNRYTRFHWPPGMSMTPRWRRVVNASPANVRVRTVRVRAAAWAWYRRRAELAKRLDAAMLKSIADNWQVGEDEDDTIPSVWPRCLRWSDRRVGEEERRLTDWSSPMARAVERAAFDTLDKTATTPPELQLAVSSAAHEVAATSFGRYMRDVRLKANVSLRDLAKALGVSHVFLSEVERGLRGLARQHWPRLLEMLPELDPLRLEHMAKLRLPVRSNVADKPAPLQDVCLLFAERVEAGKLTAEQIAAMRAILSKEGSE